MAATTPPTNAALYMARDRDPKAYWTSTPGLVRIAGWAQDGLTTRQLAENMDINHRRLMQWAGRSLDLKEAMAANRDAADREVENALRKNAMGYNYTETKRTVEIDPAGRTHKKVETFERVAKPDTASIIFYLKNRKPDTWRDNVQLDLAATVGLVQIVDDVPAGRMGKIIQAEVVDESKRITD